MTGEKGTGARPPREQSLAPFPLPLPALQPLAQLLHRVPPRRKEREAAVTNVRLKTARAVSPGSLKPRHCRLKVAPHSTRPPTSTHHRTGPRASRPAPQTERDRYRHRGTVTLRRQRRAELLQLPVTEHLPSGRGGHRRGAAGHAFAAALPHSPPSLVTGPGGWGHTHRQGLALTPAADLRSARGPWGQVRDRGLGSLASGTPGLAGSPGPLASQAALPSQGGRDRRQASSPIPEGALAPGTYRRPRAVLQFADTGGD